MSEKPLPLPASLQSARTVLCIQLALMALPLVIMLVDLMQQALAVTGSLLIPALFSVVVAVAVGLVIAKMRSRRPWVRWTALAVEAVLAVGQAWGVIIDPSVAGLAGLALAVSVIWCLLSPTSTAWFKQAASERTTL
ncbi:hypothetical protein [Nonomuraea sp. NPDC001831]|uniref:hypothetical protein n=1 Tax=Nonomuraea sp. NPDC001831 TaxID=3364340 RepID=UPI0036BDE344